MPSKCQVSKKKVYPFFYFLATILNHPAKFTLAGKSQKILFSSLKPSVLGRYLKFVYRLSSRPQLQRKKFLLNKSIFAIISTKQITFLPKLSTDVNKLLITSLSPLLLAVQQSINKVLKFIFLRKMLKFNKKTLLGFSTANC